MSSAGFKTAIEVWAIGLAVVLGAGCASTPQKVVMTGTVVQPAPDPLVGLEHYDARTLFHLAADSARKGDRPRAVALYERLLAQFPGDPVENAARFNLGLLYENAARWSDAVIQYDALVSVSVPVEDSDRRTWIDAHYRRAVCLGKLERWWEAVAVFEALEAMDWRREDDRLEALVGKGIALHEAEDRDGAELSFSQALRYFRVVSKRRRFDDRGLALGGWRDDAAVEPRRDGVVGVGDEFEERAVFVER